MASVRGSRQAPRSEPLVHRLILPRSELWGVWLLLPIPSRPESVGSLASAANPIPP